MNIIIFLNHCPPPKYGHPPRLKVHISAPTFVKRAVHLDRLLSDARNMHSYEDSRARLPCLNTTLTRLACECEFGQVASSKDI